MRTSVLSVTSAAWPSKGEREGLRVICELSQRFWGVAIVLSCFIVAVATILPCLAEAPTPAELVREGKYVKAVQVLDQAWRVLGKLSPEQFRVYVDAYYGYGKELLEKGDLQNARACFLRVIGLDARQADSYFQLGIVEKRAKNYANSLSHLRSAISLKSQHSLEANVAIVELAEECLTAAEKAIAEGQAESARSYLTFVTSNFTGQPRGKALELTTYRVIPLERAAAEYAKATWFLTGRGKAEAVKILREIPKEYPGTFYARKANELLEQLGEKVIVAWTATGLRLLPAWRRRETAHFDVYYEKEIFFNRVIPRTEEVLPQIFASFGYPKPNWKRKCKVFLFSNLSDWEKFLKSNKETLQGWFEAFSIPESMEVYLYESKDTSYMVEHTIPHELTHIVHASIVGDLRHTPMWFIEGLALLHEEGKRNEARRTLRTLRRGGTYIPLTELLSLQGYPPESEKVAMFYVESTGLMDVLLREFGPKKVREMALAYREPVALEVLLRNVLGITMDDLEKLWKRYVE